MPDMLSIRQTVQRAKNEGIPISEYGLRLWIRNGTLPTRKVGTKNLVYWPNVVAFATCADGVENSADKPQAVGR